jgi:hypothetical protein
MHTNETSSSGQELADFLFPRVRWEELQNQEAAAGAIVASLLSVCALAAYVSFPRKPSRAPVRVDTVAYFEEDE